MKYLRAVLNESLRLYPVVPENDREAEVDTVLPVGGGEDGKSPVFVAKGQIVHWSLYTMHRRKDLYGEDAEDFKPERWLDQGEKKGLRVGWEYLPFNGGPRICIGRTCNILPSIFFPPTDPSFSLFDFPANWESSRRLIKMHRAIRPHRSVLCDRPPHAAIPHNRKPRSGTLARETDPHLHRAGRLQSRLVPLPSGCNATSLQDLG